MKEGVVRVVAVPGDEESAGCDGKVSRMVCRESYGVQEIYPRE